MSDMPDASWLEPPLDPFASRSRTRELVEQLPVVVFVDTDELRGPSAQAIRCGPSSVACRLERIAASRRALSRAGLRCGRLERSRRPPSPSARNRRTHL